jgi:hypothetical protein
MRAPAIGRCAAMLAALAIGCHALPRAAAAQVNVERLRALDAEPGFSGGVAAGLSLKRGNVDFLEVTGTLWSRYHWDLHTLLGHSRAGFGEQGDERFASNAFVHARWTAMWLERIGSELFAQAEYDQFVRLQRRLLWGLGPRFVVHDGEHVDVALGTAYMLEYERLDIPAGDPHPQRTLYQRSSTYGSVRVAINDVLMVVNTLYVQPRIVRVADTRVLEELELSFAIAERIKWTTSARLRFDSDPPSQVENTDLDIKNGLEVQW